MFDVITIGGATRDIFFRVNSLKIEKAKNHIDEPHIHLPYGEKIVSDDTFYSYGGGAVNVSVGLARLGLRVAACANLGMEGTGDLVLDFLKKEKVNTSLVQRDKILHTGLTVLVLGKDGEHTGFLERGANDHLVLSSLKPFKNTRWLYITSLTGESEKVLPHIFEFAKRYDIKIAFNPGSQQLAEGYPGLREYIKQTEILFVNVEEAEKLVHSKTGKLPKNERELLAGSAKLGSTITVVTEGEIGSHALFEGHDFHQGAVPKDTVDTTGAGDAFGATFLYGIIKGFDLKYCLKIAAINSASVVSGMSSSAGLLTYDRIKKSKWL